MTIIMIMNVDFNFFMDDNNSNNGRYDKYNNGNHKDGKRRDKKKYNY